MPQLAKVKGTYGVVHKLSFWLFLTTYPTPLVNVVYEWPLKTIFETECFFELFPEVSQIKYIRTIILQIGKILGI